jgi:hypothetical protein
MSLCQKVNPDGMTCMECMPCKMHPTDVVNHPSHYAGKVECIDALESATAGLSGAECGLTWNVIKYMWRWKRKNGLQDLEKAKWYLDRLIATVIT